MDGVPVRVPTLSSFTLVKVAQHLDLFCHELSSISAFTVCDIFYQVIVNGKEDEAFKGQIELVKSELGHYPTFLRLLLTLQRREQFSRIFQVLNQLDLEKEEKFGFRRKALLPERLAAEIVRDLKEERWRDWEKGLLLGDFLLQAGWCWESAQVFEACQHYEDEMPVEDKLMCLERLLLAQSTYCMVPEARKTFDKAVAVLCELGTQSELNYAMIYNALSLCLYTQNKYDRAMSYSIKALKELQKNVELEERNSIELYQTAIDVFRQAATCCAVRRQLQKAKLLITKALCLARDIFGVRSVKYADVLMDYAYYLVSSDNVRRGVHCYTVAWSIRREAFGLYNLRCAITLTEFSYALYVQEYNSGKFNLARTHADTALKILNRLVPEDHLLQASSKRVLALILEEIAIDNFGSLAETRLLQEAEKLHLKCLYITTKIFGESNVQTAKHFGNLGRLYQSMKKYQDAEVMHLKAIAIKELLLGEDDYEVALSIGHLASLYNFDLHDFQRAEPLHLRAIQIGRKLFGDGYSGLEYDYRGLVQIYNVTEAIDKLAQYQRILDRWQRLQVEKAQALEHEQRSVKLECSDSVSAIIKDFLSHKNS